jgi:O-antigen ligase
MFRNPLSDDANGVPPFLLAALAAFVFFATFSIAGAQTALGASVLLWLVFVLRGRIPGPHRTPIDRPVILFIAACAAASLLSPDRTASLRGLKNLLLISVVYIVAYCVRTRRAARNLFLVLLVSGTASSLFGVAVYLLGRGEGTLGRSPGTFSTAMTFGGILCIVASLFVAVAIGGSLVSRARLAAWFAGASSLTALFFTFTRSSWVGMIAAAAVILSILRRRWLVPFSVALVAFALLLPPPYRDRIESIWNPAYRTNVQRIELLRGGWDIFKEHPLFGVGMHDLAELYRAHMPPGAVHVHGHLHNNFLQIAVQTGVIGLAAFAYLLVSFFILLAGNVKRDMPLPERAFAVGSLAALTGFVVNGLFEWNFGDAEVVTMLYLVIGANLALRGLSPQRPQRI